MEIISYLNSTVLDTLPYEALPLEDLLRSQNAAMRGAKTVAAAKEQPFKDARNALALAKTVALEACAALYRLRWVVLSFAAGLALCVGVATVRELVGSFPRAASFDYNPDTELALIQDAMHSFVYRNEVDDFAEDGTLFIADSSASPVAEPVTYQTYTVLSGESISSISKKTGLSNICTLISVNNIENARALRVGQKLKIPSMDGIVHTVAKNETLASVSARYGVAMEDLLDVNDLESSVVVSGQKLFIPGARLDNESLHKALGDLFQQPLKVSYRLSSQYGYRADPFTGVKSFHTGLDMACAQGTPIGAAMAGKVATVSWSNVYGNYVIVTHANGYQTLYAHMSKTSVRTGQQVAAGTQLGLVGSTGYSTGPHLHFSVYKNGKLVDPATVLK